MTTQPVVRPAVPHLYPAALHLAPPTIPRSHPRAPLPPSPSSLPPRLPPPPLQPDEAVSSHAKRLGVNVKSYKIIYELIDDVKAAMEGKLKLVEERVPQVGALGRHVCACVCVCVCACVRV